MLLSPINLALTSMRRGFIYHLMLCLGFLTLSCKENNRSSRNDEFQRQDSSKSEIAVELEDASVDHEEFLALFELVEPNGLHIFPPTWENGHEIIAPFEGKPIDVNKYRTFLDQSIFRNVEACRKGLCNIYAISRFEVDAQYLGLIVRQMSEYSETIIELVLWDNHAREIVNRIELADSFGDAGWYFDTESWIGIADDTLKIVTRRKEYIPGDEDNDEIGKVTDTLYCQSFSKNSILQKSLSLRDTTHYALKKW